MAKKAAQPNFDAELDFENDLEPGEVATEAASGDNALDLSGAESEDDLSDLIGLDESAEPASDEDEATKTVETPKVAKTKKVAKTLAKGKETQEGEAKREGIFRTRALADLKPSRAIRTSKTTPEADTELKDSVTAAGLQQPLTVLPDGTITDGNRRYRALKALGWAEVPVWEVSGLDEIESGLAASLAREELNPYDRAVAIKRLVDKYGEGGQSKVARLIGKSPAVITDALHLLEADPDTQAKVQQTGKLTRETRETARKTAAGKKPAAAKAAPSKPHGAGTGRGRGRPRTMIVLVPEDFGGPQGIDEMIVYRDAVRVRLTIPVPEGKVPAKFSHAEAGAAVLKKLSQKAFVQAVNTSREELGPAPDKDEE